MISEVTAFETFQNEARREKKIENKMSGDSVTSGKVPSSPRKNRREHRWVEKILKIKLSAQISNCKSTDLESSMKPK